MLWKEQEYAWADPFTALPAIDKALVEEYGIDSARIALICTQGNASAVSLLESSFKWISRLHLLLNNHENTQFSARPWLEAALQSYDHVIRRRNIYCGFAQIRRAMRLAPPGKNLDPLQKSLVISAVYPYCPLWARYNIADATGVPLTVPDIVESFREFSCVRFSLPAGGWHWQVFERQSFEAAPEAELLKLSWVKKAAGKRDLTLRPDGDGLKICFA